MELIDRYVYAVTRRLPAEQRADIEQELRGLIEDMLVKETQSGLKGDAAIESVLKKLGHPALLAARYRGVDQHLIGPNVFHLYVLVLKIVLLATGGGLLIAMIVNLLTNGSTHPLTTILETIGSLFTGLIGAFGWVTLIFAAIERYSPDQIQVKGAESFDPKDLPAVPQKKDRISPADPIVAMIFTLIAMVAAFYVPRFVGIYWIGMSSDDMIPLFNESVYRMYLPFIILVLAIGLIREIAKLVAGRWTIPLSIGHLLIGIPSVVLTIVMFRNPDLFNPECFKQAFAMANMTDPMILGLAMPQFISRLIIGLTLFGFVVDAITTLVRVICKAVNV